MAPNHALDLALELARNPASAFSVQKQTLPPDLLEAIHVAAGSHDACEAASLRLHEPLAFIRQAATVYLETLLFNPGADFYRNLGVEKGATRAQMRLHMRWLLRWLHPDHNQDENAAANARLVIRAWRELGRETVNVPAHEIAASQAVHWHQIQYPLRQRTKARERWIPVPISPKTGPKWLRQKRVAVTLAAFAALISILLPLAIMLSWLDIISPSLLSASVLSETEAPKASAERDMTSAADMTSEEH